MALRPVLSLPRRSATVTLLTVIVLTLTGCMRLNIAVDLHENNTAAMNMDIAFQDEAVRAMGYDPTEFWADAESEIGQGLPLGARIEPYPEAGWTGSRIVMDNTTITDLGSFEEAGLGDLTITREGDTFSFRALTGFADEMAGVADQVPQGTAPLSLTLTLTCPGLVESSNGAIGSNSVSWDLTQFSSTDELWAHCSAIATDDVRIANDSATHTASGFGRWWPVLLGGLLTLGLLGFLGYYLRRNSHRERDTVPSNFGDTANWSDTYEDPFASNPTETYVAPHEVEDWNNDAQ